LPDTRPVYEDALGQYIVEDGERIDGVWLVPQGPGKMEGEPTGAF
jgi:hypothetical protein